ncbi:patatin-like phospholipase family protein [Streptomyces sp. NPDC088360]|uniref:patatin-like phospholipase family protein n=1 Tax=Streptomyces sp. NPDC088360 TaxID=3154515 RepID=UPI00344D5007
MAKRGLALSGGGARGSFQMGAIRYLYEVLDYKPDVIAATSVGSVNALMLAQATAEDEHLPQMQRLLGIWRSLTGPGDFYTMRQFVTDLLKKDSLDLGANVDIRMVDLLIQVVFNDLYNRVRKATSLAVLDPLEARMRDPNNVDPSRLSRGVPLRMACVSLESGRLRYVTGDGRMVEADGVTPVASALPDGQAPQEQQADYTTAVARVRELAREITRQEDEGDPHEKWRKIGFLKADLARAIWRAEACFRRLARANAERAQPVQARVDPITGALASAAMPGIFAQYRMGGEHYVDGGVREVVPVDAAIDMGATEMIAIICSTQNLPLAGYAGEQNFVGSLLGSLSGTTLKEVVTDDLTAAEGRGVPLKVIIPAFDVHDTTVVDMGLIHISMDYGYMRAADVMSALGADKRRAAEELSDALAMIRAQTHRFARGWTRALDSRAHRDLWEIRFRKWIVRRLVEDRIRSGIPLPPSAPLWFQNWEQGSSDGLNERNPWNEFVTFAYTTPAVRSHQYVPDGWVFDEVGDIDGLYLVCAGGVFRATPEAIAATGNAVNPSLTVPTATSRSLPTCPVTGSVLQESAPPNQIAQPGIWYVDGTRRYLLNAASIDMLKPSRIIKIPVGGLAQIPDGGTPYWLGGLVMADSRRIVLHRWEQSARWEGTTTASGFFLWNRTDKPIDVFSVRVTTEADTPTKSLFRVKQQTPFTVPPGEITDVPLEFTASSTGTIAGEIAVVCADSVAPELRIPITVNVTPLGKHAELAISQSPIPDTLVGRVVSAGVRVTNTGEREAHFVDLSITDPTPAGQFGAGTAEPLPPGHSIELPVGFGPSERGVMKAVLSIAMQSDTDIQGFPYRRSYKMPLSAKGVAPVLFLAARRRRRISARPIDVTRPYLSGPLPVHQRPSVDLTREREEAELSMLDFGTAPAGEDRDATLWIRNLGDAPLTVRGVLIYRLDLVSLADPDALPVVVAPQREVGIVFSGTMGYFRGATVQTSINVYSDDPKRPTVSIVTRARAEGPHIVDPPEQIDLPNAVTGQQFTISFASDGTQPVSVSALTLEGSGFQLLNPPVVPLTIPSGNRLDLTVVVTEDRPGLCLGRLDLLHDGNRQGKSYVSLRARIQ